jgi:hypothetical protein
MITIAVVNTRIDCGIFFTHPWHIAIAKPFLQLFIPGTLQMFLW